MPEKGHYANSPTVTSCIPEFVDIGIFCMLLRPVFEIEKD
jgi:hypothetical protein